MIEGSPAFILFVLKDTVPQLVLTLLAVIFIYGANVNGPREIVLPICRPFSMYTPVELEAPVNLAIPVTLNALLNAKNLAILRNILKSLVKVSKQ